MWLHNFIILGVITNAKVKGSITGSICWRARGVKGQVGGSIPTGNNLPSMNGRRRVRGWGASGCSNLTCSGTRDWCARDVTVNM